MKRVFARLSIHRKLVAVALLVSTAGLLVALTGLTLIDVWRFRARAGDDAATLARLVAETSAAAVAFQDQAAAEQILSTVRIRSAVRRGCIYLDDGRIFATYSRSPEFTCTASAPGPNGFFRAAATRSIVHNGRTWGSVYVERDFSGLAGRVGVAAAAAALMLLMGTALSFVVAQRLTRGISGPIARLATGARRVGGPGEVHVPDIPASDDEIGDLVRAFQAMLVRVRDANAGLLREIEERKRIEGQRELLLERERETSRLKDEFVATVSHELRTPLGVILSWAQILETIEIDERTLERAISAISRSAGEQARIIDDLVDVSRITTGKLHVRLDPVDLRRPVEASVDAVRSAAESKGIRIALHLPEGICPVTGDPDRLRQMVGNLLSNAVKFTDDGGRITVALERVGPRYEVAVTDTGIGIAADVLPHIFDRYRQADSSTSRHYGGLGLGLSIVRELAEQHGGSVRVESEGPGRGTTFRVSLPRLAGPLANDDAGAGPQPAVPARLEGVRVLAVDDNSEALEGMATALRATGADVRSAASGADALHAWELEPADVLLCDLAMPGMDGFAVLERVREMDKRAARRTAAIAVSAHATPEHRERSLAAGFSAHVAKPYLMPDLVRAVKDALVS